MPRPSLSRKESSFFQVVIVFIFLSILCTTTLYSNGDDPTGIDQMLQQFYTLLFGSPNNHTAYTDSASTSSYAAPIDTTVTDSQDPTPPPPPPTEN